MKIKLFQLDDFVVKLQFEGMLEELRGQQRNSLESCIFQSKNDTLFFSINVPQINFNGQIGLPGLCREADNIPVYYAASVPEVFDDIEEALTEFCAKFGVSLEVHRVV